MRPQSVARVTLYHCHARGIVRTLSVCGAQDCWLLETPAHSIPLNRDDMRALGYFRTWRAYDGPHGRRYLETRVHYPADLFSRDIRNRHHDGSLPDAFTLYI